MLHTWSALVKSYIPLYRKRIHYLPEEIIKLVIDQLSLKQQITFGRTCRKYSNYILEGTRKCCEKYSLLPLVSHTDDFRWEIISKFSDETLAHGVLNILDYARAHNRELIAYIYYHTKDRKFWDSNPYLHQVRSYDFKHYEIYKSMSSSNSKFDKLLLTYFDRHQLLRLIRHFVCSPY